MKRRKRGKKRNSKDMGCNTNFNSSHDLKRACFTKTRYSTEEFATKIANRIKWERKVKLRVYFCDACAGFHLTKKSVEE